MVSLSGFGGRGDHEELKGVSAVPFWCSVRMEVCRSVKAVLSRGWRQGREQ
jgi:hypothetical protein